MSGVPASPTIIFGGDNSGNNGNPYQHQGAYAIRPRQPSLQQQQQQHHHHLPPPPISPPLPAPSDPNNIPEDVKKSYMRQQLPVRKQSLAAAATAAKAVNAFYTHSKTTRHPSNASDESTNDPTTPPPMSSPPSLFAGKKKSNNNNKEEKHVSFGVTPLVVQSEPRPSFESLSTFSEEEDEEEHEDEDNNDDDKTTGKKRSFFVCCT